MHASAPHLRLFSGNSTRLFSGQQHSTKISALKRDAHDKDRHHNGRLVDQNMVVLKKRIYDIKAGEPKPDPPANWMEWEKRYSSNYDSDVFEAIGFLQYLLMETRPSIAIAILTLFILSISTATGVVVFHFIDMVKLILSWN